MEVPFVDLRIPHRELESDLVEVFVDCLRNASFVGGPQVKAFEEEFARFCSTQFCVGVGSGTDALRFALIAAGIGVGDEVVTVPNTFMATSEVISQSGAVPVFVDIEERTYNMDPQKLNDYLKFRDSKSPGKNRVKAILPVHLYGQPAQMDALLEIAGRYGLIVIEDACQAHGASYYSQKERTWKRAGSLGLAAGFSFYPGKNLGGCGEGGAVVTNDEGLARTVSILRDHGQAKKYHHDMEGYNGRLDSIQAGILRIKLKHLPEWNEKRRQNASRYHELLGDVEGLTLPYEPPWTKAVYHLYVVRTPKRDGLQGYLAERGIQTGLHYPIPLHLQTAYHSFGFRQGAFPVAEKAAKEVLSLPMYPELEPAQQQEVAARIREFLATAGD